MRAMRFQSHARSVGYPMCYLMHIGDEELILIEVMIHRNRMRPISGIIAIVAKLRGATTG